MPIHDQSMLFASPEDGDGISSGDRPSSRMKAKRAGKPPSRPPASAPAFSSEAPAEGILDDLTDAQREAVEHEDGPMLVLAGAGSGKTRVITRRVARLVQKGVYPRSILSITFTNKAAGEMKARVEKLVGARGVWVSTFHSFCARILREDAELLGYPREFTIYDEDDAERCMKEALGEVSAPETLKAGRARSQVSAWKSALIGPDEAESRSDGYRERKLAGAYRVYERLLRERKSMDFDDLLLRALEIFRVHEEARAKWQRRIRYLQVDEYQDTNRIQFELVKLLAGEGRNAVVVGDPNQSIYSWRGADPANIDDYLATYAEARVVKLDTNFRSRQSVLDAASALMLNSESVSPGRLKGVRGEGERPRLVITRDELAEAGEIARRIDAAIGSGRSARDFAVFYRTNAQSRAFEQAFIQRGIPYAIVGAVAFYQRREVKDAIAYLRAAVNRADDVSFERIANVPRRGLGKEAMARFVFAARERSMSLAEAVRDPRVREAAGPRASRGLAELDVLLGRLAELAKGPAAPAVSLAVEGSGLRRFFEAGGEEDRVENLDELVSAAQGYDDLHPEIARPAGLAEALDIQGEDPPVVPLWGLAGFLEEAALISDLDRWDETRERATLMTLHAAKGLEFPSVHIAGLEDGILPHVRVINEGNPAGFEEERRLLYVGMTRAEDELTLTYARSRRRAGPQSGLGIRSRFIKDIPESHLMVEDLSAPSGSGEWESQARPGFSRGFRPRQAVEDFPVEDLPSEPSPEEEMRAARRKLAEMDDLDEGDYDFGEGDRVRHPRWGVGRVIAVKGYGSSAKLTIDFPGTGRKTVALGFAQLKKELR